MTYAWEPWSDGMPSRRPYPDTMPTFVTRHGDPTARDVHLAALHATQRAAHEDAVLVDGGETSRLGQLKRAILEGKALTEELGTGVVTLAPETARYLEMDGPTEAMA